MYMYYVCTYVYSIDFKCVYTLFVRILISKIKHQCLYVCMNDKLSVYMMKELHWRRLAPTKMKTKTKLPMGRTSVGTAAVAQKTAAYCPMAVQAYAVVPYRKYENRRTTYIHMYIYIHTEYFNPL